LEIAWLAEDEWGVASFLDLLVKILHALGAATKELATLAGPNVEKRAAEMLSERLGRKTLFLILENADSVLRNLGESGQKKLRALIQNTRQWSILATATALSEDIQRHAAPFYGFFEIQHLKGLSDEEGIMMLYQLAVAQGKSELAAFLTTPGGRARVRALQHLAQGNHRVLIVFYDFLDKDARQDLVTLLWKTIDALTPYYQSQMKELSPQQRKLVDFLCRHTIPATVKVIASECFVSHQTAAAQLKQLLEARYVRVERHGRESYYELSEPLLRICVEAKGHSTEPLPLLVELLRYWFSRKELAERLRVCAANWDRGYFEAALHKYENGEGHTHLSMLVRESCARMRKAHDEGDAQEERAAAEELAEIAERDEDWTHYASAQVCLGNPEHALALVEQAGRVQPNDAPTHWALAKLYLACKRPQDALAVVDRAVELDQGEDMYWALKGRVLQELNRSDDALGALIEAKRLDPNYSGYSIDIANLMLELGKPRDAAKLLRRLLRHGVKTPEVLVNLGVSLASSGKEGEALPVFQEASALFPEDPYAWVNLAKCRLYFGENEAAATAVGRARVLVKDDPDLGHAVCTVLFRLNRYKEASETLPSDIVAHAVFHELVELADRRLGKEELVTQFRELRSRVAGQEWAAAFRGGIWELLSHLGSQLEHASADGLAALRDILGELGTAEPEFADAERLVDVMIRYKGTGGDTRVLLELPLEQRKLLLPGPR
jgi:tetratricopeptide (TPR) repeat protein